MKFKIGRKIYTSQDYPYKCRKRHVSWGFGDGKCSICGLKKEKVGRRIK